MASFDFPDNAPIAEPSGIATDPWRAWFSRVQAIVAASQQSGTTANRPTKVLWIGRRYWDVTLQKPVFVAGVNPTVWKDAAGAIDASFTYDPPSLAAGASVVSGDFAVAGAALGDYVQVAAPYDLVGVRAGAYVKAAGIVVVILTNTTGAAVDLASGTWKVRVTR